MKTNVCWLTGGWLVGVGIGVRVRLHARVSLFVCSFVRSFVGVVAVAVAVGLYGDVLMYVLLHGGALQLRCNRPCRCSLTHDSCCTVTVVVDVIAVVLLVVVNSLAPAILARTH